MEAALQRPIPAQVRMLLFGMSLLLLFAGAVGYAFWQKHATQTISTASATPEQIYYQQMVYAVNEMNNQATGFHNDYAEGKLAPEQVAKGLAYVTSLVSSFTSPPEELTVAQFIADQMQQSYRQYVALLQNGETDKAKLQAAFDQVKKDFAKFRQNAALITMLNAYSGVNIYCH